MIPEPWGDLIVAAVLFLIGGVGLGLLSALSHHRANERKARNERAKFWGAIPALSRTLAGEPGSRLNIFDWTKVLETFYGAGYSLEEAERLIRLFVGIFGKQSKPWDFEDFLARKNAWSIQTFGPGDAADRVAGLSDHIRKELDELKASPWDVEEWIDVAFLSLDGAYRAGADPHAVCLNLEAKLAKNRGRHWPDWRTVEPGKAIEHVRTQS